jgi:predicted DNA-binding transcriptional regulator AlpA
VKLNQFPQPVRLSSRVTAWRLDDIIKWLTTK